MEKKWIITYLSIFLIITILITVIMTIYFNEIIVFIRKLTDIINNNLNENVIISILICFGVQFCFHVLFLKGVTIFNTLLGYFVNNIWVSLGLVYFPTVICSFIVYPISKYLFKNKVYSLIKDKWYFKFYYEKSKNNPNITSWILRSIFIPVAYKNYLIPLLEINFIQYAIPSIFFYLIYTGFMVIIGYTAQNIENIWFKKSFSELTTTELINQIFLYLLMAILAGVIIFLIYFTVKEYKKYKKTIENENNNKIENKL